MGSLIEYMSMSPVQSIMVILLFLAAAKGFYESVTWFRSQLEKWYDGKRLKDDAAKEIEERIDTLEDNDNQQFEMINKIQDSINNISNKIDDMHENQKRQSLTMTRTSLNAMYPMLKEQGYLTKSQYETWFDLAQIYLDYGGNHTFAEKIIPEVNNLPVKEI